ncbi:transcriptional regulator [Clostridia bacterium]|nr:transcriptional regulator [Clostridia bacterium]
MGAYEYILEDTHFKIHEASRTTVTRDWSRVVSVYPYNRIYLIMRGEAEIVLKNETIKLQAGNLYFLPAFQVMTSDCQDMMEHYYIHFQTTATTLNRDLLESYSFRTQIQAEENSELYFKIATDNRFPKNVSEQIKLDAALRLLLAPFILTDSLKDFKTELFADVLDYIGKNINAEIEISELAQIANFNRSYFSLLFKETFGVPPKTFILNQKLKIAQTLLLESDMTCGAIAASLGFESNMYFSRLFKSKLSMAPSQYRSQSKKL